MRNPERSEPRISAGVNNAAFASVNILLTRDWSERLNWTVKQQMIGPALRAQGRRDVRLRSNHTARRSNGILPKTFWGRGCLRELLRRPSLSCNLIRLGVQPFDTGQLIKDLADAERVAK